MGARFVGRAAETDQLVGLLAEARAGRGAFALISGEPGIGRTALVQHVSEAAAGFDVLWATCWANDQVPCWALVQLARRFAVVTGTPGVDREWFAEGTDRFRLFDTFTQLLSSAERPQLVVVDDLHWADVGSLRYLEFLGHQVRDSRIVVVGTTEDGRLPAELVRLGTRVPLGGLSEGETRELLHALTGRESDAGHVHRRTGGNPSLVTEIALHPGKHIPETVRHVLDRRLAHLSPDAMELLTVGAVLGARFDLREVAAMTHKSVMTVRAALPFDDGVVVQGDAHTVEFPYTLMRDVILARLTPADEVALHRRAAEVVGHDAARLAAHFSRACHAPEAVRYGVEAGRAAIRSGAYEAAVGHFHQTVALLTDPGKRARLLVELAGAQRLSGDPAAAMATARQALELARAVGDHETAGWAALADGHQSPLGEIDWTPVHGIERVLADLPGDDSELRARLLARLAVDTGSGAVAGQAVAMARRVDQPEVIITALIARHDTLRWRPETVHERLAIAAEAVELGTGAGVPESVAEGRLRQLESLLELGQRAAAERVLAECGLLVNQTRNPLWHHLYMTATARLRWLERDFAAAVDITRTMLDGADAVPWVTPMWHEFAASLALAAGDTAGAAEAEARFVASVAATPPHWTRPMWQALEARLAARMGRLADARLTLDQLLAEGVPAVIDRRGGLACLACLAEVAYLVGADEYAADILTMARPYAQVVVLFVWTPMSHYLSLLATMVGDAAEAELHRRSTVDIARRMGARLWLDDLEPPQPPGSPDTVVLAREGDYWTLGHAGNTARLRHGKGMEYLAGLLARPGVETHALHLAGETHPNGTDDLGPHLDARAKAAYKQRLGDLRADLAEATEYHDLERARKARDEIDALVRELARTVGLRGRDRPNGSAAERARINVTRRLRSTIDRISEIHPGLGYHLDTAIRTGTFCSYQPGPAPSVSWRVNIVPSE
nr:AAA family ATPase [Kibdelosporangium sp. MJ126-NF4]CTQ96946.1 regulatory protein, LuxR [Kibdelosporangium sp. MJ126-NF4]